MYKILILFNINNGNTIWSSSNTMYEIKHKNRLFDGNLHIVKWKVAAFFLFYSQLMIMFIVHKFNFLKSFGFASINPGFGAVIVCVVGCPLMPTEAMSVNIKTLSSVLIFCDPFDKVALSIPIL